MAYNGWKMMDKVGVAVCSRKPETWRGKEQFDGYIFEASDDKAKESAVEWARRYDDRYDSTKETVVHEPNVHIFDNEGFTVTILDSAGGSSQGGRLSFWKCRVEKDGVEFVVGVNDAILADLIRNSDIEKGTVKQNVMFARRGGQPGFIHEAMESYKEAVADMKKKADMKSAKKTSKWERGGVYSTLTQMSVCLGQVNDLYEEYKATDSYSSWYSRNYDALRKRQTPAETTAWLNIYRFQEQEIPESFNALLKKELKDRSYIYFYTGKPPARPKVAQLEVIEEDLELLDKLFSARKDTSYENQTNKEIKGRYVRTI